MKISRHKKVQKYLSFYCNNYGFRKPFQVLVDGTICHAALKNKLNIKEQFPKYLDGDAKLLTTQCVIIETEKLGGMVYGAMVIVKQFAVHKCGHEKNPISAAACLESMLGVQNASRYIIATQDRELQAVARRIPGTPVMYLHLKTPILEQPSDASARMARLQTRSLFGMSRHEQTAIDMLKTTASIPHEGVTAQKKKKKRKGPNSLSCKKKQKKDQVTSEPQVEAKKVRKRKRVKLAPHLKEHWLAQAKTALGDQCKK